MRSFRENYFGRLISFSIAGLITTALSTGLYMLLVDVGLPYLVANIVAFLFGTGIAYVLNIYAVFRVKANIGNSSMFLVIRLVTLVLQSIILWMLVHFGVLSKYWASIAVIPPVVLFSYVLTKWLLAPGKDIAVADGPIKAR